MPTKLQPKSSLPQTMDTQHTDVNDTTRLATTSSNLRMSTVQFSATTPPDDPMDIFDGMHGTTGSSDETGQDHIPVDKQHLGDLPSTPGNILNASIKSPPSSSNNNRTVEPDTVDLSGSPHGFGRVPPRHVREHNKEALKSSTTANESEKRSGSTKRSNQVFNPYLRSG